MHGLIRDRLEDYLLDAPGKKLPLEIEQHLRTCENCREELSWMQEQCQLLRGLRPSRQIEPTAGFYARVIDRIEAQQKFSFWNAFLDPVFGRRLVAATLTMAVMLVGYLAFTESEMGAVYPASASAASIMAVDEHPPGLGVDRQRDRETMFVTLATYHGSSQE